MKYLSGQTVSSRYAVGLDMVCVPRDLIREAVATSARAWGAGPDRAENVALDVSSALAEYDARRRADLAGAAPTE